MQPGIARFRTVIELRLPTPLRPKPNLLVQAAETLLANLCPSEAARFALGRITKNGENETDDKQQNARV